MPALSPSPLSAPPKASPSPSASAPAISPSGFHPLAAPPHPVSPLPSTPPAHSPHKHSWRNYSLVTAGSAVFLVMAAASVIYYRAKKVGTVRPWATGLSGQLQRAFVTGVPAVKRSELQAACEDFSNIVGSTPSCMLYKGTLSSGVEIAVVLSSITSIKEWSKECESHYRKKITSLSKVSHKNFMNLLGYCEEDHPFTTTMVFEYAPNGTLFEHLHGTDDSTLSGIDGMVHKYGIILLEILTGKAPYYEEEGLVEQWASGYLDGNMSAAEVIDSSLGWFPEEAARALCEVARWCMEPDPKKRPQMPQVGARMKEITALGPEGATPNPKMSPLWWAELEIMSSEGS
ncbi:hypothetical protein C2845_PM04G34810 [Panicum miliaceum]|uniref:Protein kinase domain-containing protein n=1 Tax=Panicum miliaceum TaxID=4540 RepID=A0A3L6QPT6_PANMI|nr:hypothetical protein C2845_PM04G34810 [Panicum miliaceum]